MAGGLETMGWWPVIFQIVNLILLGMVVFLIFYYFRKAWKGFWQEMKDRGNDKERRPGV